MPDIDPIREFIARGYADWWNYKSESYLDSDYESGLRSGALDVLEALARETDNEDLIPFEGI